MIQENLLERHLRWANRVTLGTLAGAIAASIPMFVWLYKVPAYLRVLCVALESGMWILLWASTRVESMKRHTRYGASLALNAFALLMMFILGKPNAAVPFLFFSLLGFVLIYLDATLVLFTAIGTILSLAVLLALRADLMFLNYTPRTTAYMIFMYLITVPAAYAAAKRASGLLSELQQRELAERKLNESLTQVLGHTAETSERLKEASAIVSNHAGELQALSEQTAAGMEQMARMVDIQAGEVARVSRNVTEINALAEHIVRKSQELSDGFHETVNAANQGVQVVQSVVGQMTEAAVNMGVLLHSARQLKESSLRISEVLTFMSSLAHQTNLLSINATIEAARDGGAGKGFLLVADEIRRLAEQFERGAAQTRQIVSATSEEIDRVLALVEEGSDTVSRGAGEIALAGGDFEHILGAIQRAATRVNEVCGAMGELVAQNNCIMDAANALAALSQETAAGTQEISSTAERQAEDVDSIAGQARNLNDAARALDEIVSEYRNADSVRP